MLSCLDFKWCRTDNIFWLNCNVRFGSNILSYSKKLRAYCFKLKLYARYLWVCYLFITIHCCQQYIRIQPEHSPCRQPFYCCELLKNIYVVCYVSVWCTYLDSFSIQMRDLLVQNLIMYSPTHIGTYLVHFWSPDMHWWSSINRVFCEVLILQLFIWTYFINIVYN